ncbi:MAG: Crossover junction endodeoxyribonuclease RuvC [Candidatus Dependentiae bacterium ADurb.Bin331]|nr:MAG: Crossover junction endodeoxyribonuclease RuvC [Candidatus Dependentiae bacterium ADurb.Bin331]
MVILGIDPGFSITGFGVISNEMGKTILREHGYLKLPTTKSLPERIGIFHAFFEEKINKHHVEAIALETPFLGKNAQNFLKLGYLRGILYLLSDKHKAELYEFAPREVKLAVTGFGGAEKEQVARVIYRLFPAISIVEKADVTDAIAITLCGLWKSKQKNSLAHNYLQMNR